MGAENSAVVVDLPRCGPMLSPRVPNLVPIPGPRMQRETPGQRPRPNYGHPHAQLPQTESKKRGTDHLDSQPGPPQPQHATVLSMRRPHEWDPPELTVWK